LPFRRLAASLEVVSFIGVLPRNDAFHAYVTTSYMACQIQSAHGTSLS